MSAIELCRTAELGGHIEGCRSCGTIRVAYNSCRNRHCPKCQGQACREWLAARAGRASAGSLFPRCVHAAGRDRRDRLPEQGAGLRHPVQDGGRDAAHDRRRSQAPRRRDRPHRRAAQLGPEPALSSPHPLHRCRAAASPSMERAGSPAGRGSSCPCACCRACFAACFWRNCERPSRRASLELLRRSCPPGRARCLRPLAWPKPRRLDWVVYAKPPFGGPEQVLAYLGRYTHRVAIANSRLISMDGRSRRVPLEGLSPSRQDEGHDARRARVHPPLPAAHAAGRLPSHPPLRLPRQRPSRRQARPVPQAAGQTATGRSRTKCRKRCCHRRAPCGSASLPMLWRTNDHARHLAVRTGTAEPVLERHLMIAPRASSSSAPHPSPCAPARQLLTVAQGREQPRQRRDARRSCRWHLPSGFAPSTMASFAVAASQRLFKAWRRRSRTLLQATIPIAPVLPAAPFNPACNEVRSVGGIDVVPADLTEASRFHLRLGHDSSSGCGQSRAVAGWPRSPGRPSATRLI